MTQLVVFLLINRLIAMGQGEAVPWKPRETVFLNLRVSAVTQTGHSNDVQEGEAAPSCDTGGGGDEVGQRLRSAGHRAQTPPTPVSFVTTSRARFVPRSKRLALRNTAARRRTPAGNSLLRSVPRKPQTTRES